MVGNLEKNGFLSLKKLSGSFVFPIEIKIEPFRILNQFKIKIVFSIVFFWHFIGPMVSVH